MNLKRAIMLDLTPIGKVRYKMVRTWLITAWIALTLLVIGSGEVTAMEILITLIGAGGLTGLVFFFRWCWKRTFYSWRNFILGFYNQIPLVQNTWQTLKESASPKILPFGEHILILGVSSRWRFPVKRINLRFLEYNGQNAEVTTVRVKTSADPFHNLIWQDDSVGGLDGIYTEVRGLAAGESLYYEITIIAQREWSGILSFRAQDEAGFRSVGRYAVEIRKNAAPLQPPPSWRDKKFATVNAIAPPTIPCESLSFVSSSPLPSLVRP